MIRRLIILLLIVGCDYAPTEHTHDDLTFDGYVFLWGEFYSIQTTTYLNLSGNQLTGEIPSEIGNLTNLTELQLNNTQLTGSIPPEIGSLTNLTYLALSINQLTGEIPQAVCDLIESNNLSILNITSGNNLINTCD